MLNRSTLILNNVFEFMYVIVERFHSQDQRPYWLAKTKDEFCIKNKIEFNSQWDGLVFQNGCHFFVLEDQMNMADMTSYQNALLLRCSVADSCSVINPKHRVDCGWPGVSEDRCVQMGCCFDSSIQKVRYCFYKAGKAFAERSLSNIN